MLHVKGYLIPNLHSIDTNANEKNAYFQIYRIRQINKE